MYFPCDEVWRKDPSRFLLAVNWLFCIRCNFPISIFVWLGYAGWYYWLCVTEGSFFFTGGVVSLLRSCFPVGEFYFREVLSLNSGRVASFFKRFFEIFGYFSQKWFERNRFLKLERFSFHEAFLHAPEEGGGGGGRVLLGILGGGVPPGSSNPDPIFVRP